MEALYKKVYNLIVEEESDFTNHLNKLLISHECRVRIAYDYKLEGNTSDDNMYFRIRFGEKPYEKTKIRLSFKISSPTLIFKKNLISAIAEMINNGLTINEFESLLDKYNIIGLVYDLKVQKLNW